MQFGEGAGTKWKRRRRGGRREGEEAEEEYRKEKSRGGRGRGKGREKKNMRRKKKRKRWKRRMGRRKSNPPYKFLVGETKASFPLEAPQMQKAAGGRRWWFSGWLLWVCFPWNVGGRWPVAQVSCSPCLHQDRWK